MIFGRHQAVIIEQRSVGADGVFPALDGVGIRCELFDIERIKVELAVLQRICAIEGETQAGITLQTEDNTFIFSLKCDIAVT